MRLLIADDDPTFTLYLEKVLQKLGHEAVVTRDGAEAWDLVQKEKFPIVLTDWMMPRVNGPELCRRIRSLDDRCYTYLLMLTCRGGREDRLEALRSGVDDFLTKPIDREELSARLTIAQRVLETQQKLAAERTLLRTLVDSLPDYIYVKDSDGRYVIDNIAHQRLLGAKTTADVVGKTVFDFFPEELATQYDSDDRAVMQSGQPLINREEPVTDSANNTTWVSTTKVPLRDDTGGVVGVVCMSRDITQRRKVEEQLRLQATALESVANAIVITDANGTILWVNPAFSYLTGYSADDVIGQTPRMLKSGQHPPSFYEDLWKTITSGRVWRGEIVNRRKDGSLYTEEMSVTPVQNDSGEITHFIGLKQDISARKDAEEKLRRAHLETEQLLASISSILIGVDQDDRVTRWNAAAEGAFGIPATQAVGRPIGECGIGWDWAMVLQHIAECRLENRVSRLDSVRYTRADGREGFLTLIMNPIRSDAGETAGYLILGTDVTECKVLESQLTQAQKLESIGQLAAGIAHEINTPTQYVGDNTRFLRDAFSDLGDLLAKYNELVEAAKQEAVPAELVAEVESAVENVDLDYLREEIPKAIEQSLEGVERVATIVRAMKEFSHPGVEEKTATDINRAIESTLTVARNEWKYVAELVTDFDPDLPLLPCLAGEFNQVILNMIINAAHAIADVVGDGGEKKGTITVSTRRNGEWVEIRISDTGTGIPEENRGKVFDPFFTTKDVGKGTGQGLSIAHAVIVRKHGGQIDFETETGKGTTFIIRLPIQGDCSHRREAA